MSPSHNAVAPVHASRDEEQVPARADIQSIVHEVARGAITDEEAKARLESLYLEAFSLRSKLRELFGRKAIRRTVERSVAGIR